MVSEQSIADLVARATDFSAFEPPAAETAPGARPRPAHLRVVEPRDPRPAESWGYMNGTFKLSDRGVCFLEEDKDGHPRETWVCSPLRVSALTRDGDSHSWGRLLEWSDADGKEHRWSMPAALLQGDGVDLRKELAAGGARIGPHPRARALLIAYLQTAPAARRARCVDRLGWHGDTYLTVEGGYGPERDVLVYQSESTLFTNAEGRGDMESWKQSIARLSAGNSRLVFAVSAAFAAPLLELAAMESGGFHLVGHSSTGKSTALRAAASVWGNPGGYVRTWRATGNGLEGIASQHNDGLLVLDELHQCDPREAGEIVYMLGNGQGKARACRTGAARRAASWRVLYLSSGEQSLDARLGETGRRSTAGQEVRLPSIPADAGAGMGIVEELHEFKTSLALVQALDDAGAGSHGIVGRAWLLELACKRAELRETLPAGLDAYVRSITSGLEVGGQAARVARRFALVALAGDLATARGLTGWSNNEAERAARRCYQDWLQGFGAGDKERARLLAQVRGFLERHGSARFERTDGGSGIVRDRVGFLRETPAGMQYLVLPESFKLELVRGFDPRWAIAELIKEGWLLPGGRRPNQSVRVAGEPMRLYVLKAALLGEAGPATADEG